MPKINSLYELIKQKSQEKDRPLKIVSGWDDVTFAFRPTVVHKFDSSGASSKQFFEEFWESADELTTLQDGTMKFVWNGKGEIKKTYDEFTKLFEERKTTPDKNADKYKILDVVEEMSFLNVSEDLLKCLKEDLISELVVLVRTRNIGKESEPSFTVKSRKKRFANTFGKFAQCKLDLFTIKVIDGKHEPFDWNWVKDNHPDFDVNISGDYTHIEMVSKDFPDKVYVMLDYKPSRHVQGKNIYRFKPTVSDLKDEDFVKVAEEYQNYQDYNFQ